MGKRDPYSRWNRLPPVFRSGEHKIPGPDEEPQRIILYLPGALLDRAEELADEAGIPTIQEYCAGLLARAIDVERVKRQLSDVEARRGPLEGFKEIAEDASYLAEWRERHGAKDAAAPSAEAPEAHEGLSPAIPAPTVPIEDQAGGRLPEPPDVLMADQPAADAAEERRPEPLEDDQPPEPPRVRIETARSAGGPTIAPRVATEVLDQTALEAVLRHVGLGDDDPRRFLPGLRRGRPAAPGQVSELLEALKRIEEECRGSPLLERRLAYLLHRLALESQVLLTEAWPGVFDAATVAAIRAVQEGVDRILSGQDVRYYPTQPGRPAEGIP